MILFLTSSPCTNDVPAGVNLPCVLDRSNGFVRRLRRVFPQGGNLLIIASDPEAFEGNDEMTKTFWDVLHHHGLHAGDVALLDARTAQDAASLVAMSHIIILSGGHVPTESAFFESIHLRELLTDYNGVVMGISAGTMNCAEVVYAQPELEGESIDPDYQRFIPGLGLTRINVLPHYQQVKDNILDGQRLYEDITYADSHGHPFFALVDGSYIYIEDGHAELFGEAYLIYNGRIRPWCVRGGHKPFRDMA